jgi:hypothetical protein
MQWKSAGRCPEGRPALTGPSHTHSAASLTLGVNRSLEGGIEILQTSRSFDTFRSDADLLGNGEFAKRTGLSRPTMVRLTQTLVGMGILQQKPAPRGQCLTRSLVCCATRKD